MKHKTTETEKQNEGFLRKRWQSLTLSLFLLVGTFSIANAQANMPPVITTDNAEGFAENSIDIVEDIQTIDDNDTEMAGGLSYSFVDGPFSSDKAFFEIESGTGEITFLIAPDFENPADANADNIYDVSIQVCDSGNLCDTLDLLVIVLDLPEYVAIGCDELFYDFLTIEPALNPDFASSLYRVNIYSDVHDKILDTQIPIRSLSFNEETSQIFAIGDSANYAGKLYTLTNGDLSGFTQIADLASLNPIFSGKEGYTSATYRNDSLYFFLDDPTLRNKLFAVLFDAQGTPAQAVEVATIPGLNIPAQNALGGHVDITFAASGLMYGMDWYVNSNNINTANERTQRIWKYNLETGTFTMIRESVNFYNHDFINSYAQQEDLDFYGIGISAEAGLYGIDFLGNLYAINNNSGLVTPYPDDYTFGVPVTDGDWTKFNCNLFSVNACTGDPETGDEDSDFICNDLDNCPTVFNFDQADCDGDGIGDACEADDDNDGIPNDCDLCFGDNASGDADGDGICGTTDNCPDDDNPDQSDCDGDGIGDICEEDTDGDGIPDDCDTCIGSGPDSDNDGYCDDVDNCPNNADTSQADCDGDGVGDVCESDSDNDGIPDDCDTCFGDNTSGDTDGDGYCDNADSCPDTSDPTQADCDGDGIGDVCESDDDNDGIPNDCDTCFGDNTSGDTDGDGYCDNADSCPDTADPTQADCDGDGIGDVCESDEDNDGIPNDCDSCFGDNTTGDNDGDGICGDSDNCPDTANANQSDCDGDGIGDSCETDSDGDGVPDDCDNCFGNAPDSDNDGICDDVDNCPNNADTSQADCDGDGIGDVCESDDDNDGIPNDCDSCFGNNSTGDTDGDGFCDDEDDCPDEADPNQSDCDGDGIGDVCESDNDNDGLPDDCDTCVGDNATGDTDGDGYCDDVDNCPAEADPTQADCDGDGIGDICESDDDNDGIPNDCDICFGNNATGDTDGDGFCDDEDDCPDEADPNQSDCDGDGIGDVCESDNDNDGLPDDCDTCIGNNATGDTDGDGYCDDVDNCPTEADPTQADCDGDGVGDLCELDDDNDGLPNDCDTCVGDNTTGDTDGDGYCDDVDNCPTEADPTQADCDGDGVGDVCESDDDNDNIPNDCDTCIGNNATGDTDGDGYCDDVDNCPTEADPTQADCDGDGIGDLCESDDDNDNIPNDCDTCVGDNTTGDTDGDGYCNDVDNCNDSANPNQADCDGDGIGDLCESDGDNDGIPDDCDPIVGCNNYAAIADVVGGGCVAVGEFAQLQAIIETGDTNPASYTFSWTGPNNFFSTAQTPMINNLSVSDAGTYTVVITSIADNCSTELTVELPVSLEPAQPFVASSNEVVCIGGDLIVFVTSNNDMPLPQVDHYEWTGPLGSTSSGAYPNESAIVISDFEIAYNGVYQVVVTQNGCPSMASEPLGVFAADLVNSPAVESNIDICQGEILALETSTLAEEYFWSGPNGFSSTEQNPLVSNSANTLFDGEYTLVVTNEGCDSPGSVVTVTVGQTPATPALEVVPTICNGGDIVLVAEDIPGATYQWISPSNLPTGFFGSGPTADNVVWTEDATTTISAALNPIWYEAGAWRVQTVTAAGCVSAPSLPILVDLAQTPPAPFATTIGDVCEGQAIQLFATEIPGAGYRWYDGDPAASPPPNLIATVKDPIVSGFAVGTYTFYVESVLGACNSETYGQVEVTVSAQPSLSGVTNTGPYCQDATIELDAPFISGALYYWEGPNNFVSGLQNPIIENAQFSSSGIYTLYVSVDGCNSIVVSTNVLVGSDQVGVPIAVGSSLVCEGEDILLSVSNPVLGATYEWFDSLGNVFVDLGEELLIESATAADGGTYYVVATLGACVSDPSMTTTAGEDAFIHVQVQVPNVNVPWLGDEIYNCEDTLTVKALPLNGGEGLWSWADSTNTATIHYPTSESTFVSGLLEGNNNIVWTTFNGVCGFASSDTLLIEWSSQNPKVVGENYDVPFNGRLTNIDLEANDTPYTQAYYLSLLSAPEHGTFEEQDNGQWIYEAEEGFAGEDQVEYQICHEYCPDKCGQAVAKFEIGKDISCVTPTVITPNGDGLNDQFIIPCIYNTPGSSLSVFNRWGTEIYFSENYQNDWEGTFNKGNLPSGTYFYIIELNDGNATRLSGHVFIER